MKYSELVGPVALEGPPSGKSCIHNKWHLSSPVYIPDLNTPKFYVGSKPFNRMAEICAFALGGGVNPFQ